MKIFSNSIYLSNKTDKSKSNEMSWFSPLVVKSDAEPGIIVEKMLSDKHVDSDPGDINERNLEKRSDDDFADVLERQHSELHEYDRNNKHNVYEKQLDEADTRNPEFYSQNGIPLFINDVYIKEKKRSEENEKFYKDNPEWVDNVSVVSASATGSFIIKWFDPHDNTNKYIFDENGDTFNNLTKAEVYRDNFIRFAIAKYSGDEHLKKIISSVKIEPVKSSFNIKANLMEEIYINKKDPKDSDYNKDNPYSWYESDVEDLMSGDEKEIKNKKKK